QVDVLDEDWEAVTEAREATERTAIVLGQEHVETFDFHFASSKAELVPADDRTLDCSIETIRGLYAQHPDAAARIDCWASPEGSGTLNRELSKLRCAWFEATVWPGLRARERRRLRRRAGLREHGPDDHGPIHDAHAGGPPARRRPRGRQAERRGVPRGR